MKRRTSPSIMLIALALLTLCAHADMLQAQELIRAAPDRYLLQPGDVFEVQYRYSPEFNQTVTVQPDGFVSLEIGNEVKVAGLTIEAVRERVLQRARQRLNDPEMTLVLREFQRPYFVVAGHVAQPGKFEMRENLTAFQAVMLAGGFRETAKTSQVLVFRKINAETAEVRALNFKKIKRTADLEHDLLLRSGDMILVPADTMSKVERYVRLASVAGIFGQLLAP